MKRIIILDDNFEILLLYKTLVSHMGYSVRTTTTGQEALRLLDEEPCDLILTDMKMPMMNGLEFIRTAREGGYTGKVIIITAFPTMADATHLKNLHVEYCLIKPVLLTKLEETIRSTLEEPFAESSGALH